MKQRILYLQYTNPAAYPPLQHSATILAEAGWQVLFLGIAARGAAGLVLPPHANITVKQIGGTSGGAFASARYALFALRALRLASRFRPQWCYASDAHSAPVALQLKRLIGARVLYHEHDAPPARARLKRARDELALEAEIVIAPAQARLETLPHGSGPRFVVWNCPRRHEVREAECRPDSFRLVYHGSLSRERLTPQLIDALALLPGHVDLNIYGYETAGHHGYVRELLQRAERVGVAERVHYHGVIPERSELLQRLAAHHLGIATVARSADRNLQTLAGASNKAFEYLACGVPLLISREPSWQELYQRAGYAVDCEPEEAASIAQAVASLMSRPEVACAMGRQGRERIAREWNYETQFAPVLERLAR